ncbi:Metallo-dependent phosphatase-like protein [Triangularia verruculosa]|uniref:Metallo-dependent phosphatase-like protein n=1 Tax=Triangularia verruculosa TaxID=2587418 RepID=A0AAN6XIN1_9PEZI|nr:Metallo-dependent phosphatase-like protein [Triangularia verruculosa]
MPLPLTFGEKPSLIGQVREKSATKMQQPSIIIKTRGQRKRSVATRLLNVHCSGTARSSPKPVDGDPIRIVCVSDTHNHQPVLPPGDILIHAGDLTENGSFDEVQAGLDWLSSQPHAHKILIAGNHDLLLDEAFLARYPERRYGETRRTKADLNWGTVTYLEDSTITITVADKTALNQGEVAGGAKGRKLTIYGSPYTPVYTPSAFQYSPSPDFWSNSKLGELTPQKDLIVVTHGPPKFYLDRRDFHRAGCPYLLQEISRLRPRLHVFGHIHAAYGKEEVALDSVREAHDDIMIGWGGWWTVVWMAILVGWTKAKRVSGFGKSDARKTTTFVNASVVGGMANSSRDPAAQVITGEDFTGRTLISSIASTAEDRDIRGDEHFRVGEILESRQGGKRREAMVNTTGWNAYNRRLRRCRADNVLIKVQMFDVPSKVG